MILILADKLGVPDIICCIMHMYILNLSQLMTDNFTSQT